jgi:hypothetical protein
LAMRTALTCTLLLLPVLHLCGQTNGVTLCGVYLEPGTPKATVLDELSKKCKLEKWADGPDMWTVHVQVKGVDRWQNFVRFDDGKLTQVSKDLGTAHSDDTATVLAEVIQAVDRIMSQGDAPTPTVRVKTIVRKHPDGTDWVDTLLDLGFGPKSLTINVSRPVGQSDAMSYVSCTEGGDWVPEPKKTSK